MGVRTWWVRGLGGKGGLGQGGTSPGDERLPPEQGCDLYYYRTPQIQASPLVQDECAPAAARVMLRCSHQLLETDKDAEVTFPHGDGLWGQQVMPE